MAGAGDGESQYLAINEDYPNLKLVSRAPPIYTVTDFITADDCQNLIKLATPLLQRSKTHAIAGSEATKGRTSLTCHLPKNLEICQKILENIKMLTNKPFGHMELPQVARYSVGQRYVDHYDGVDPQTPGGQAFCASGGQRVATVLMYLNDVPEGGGGTHFSRINLTVQPKRGTAVIFFPGFLNGLLDKDALHAGLPPLGTKWVSQVWIRQSFREDGLPSTPASREQQVLSGPLHKGTYAGMCIAGNDVFEAVMTYQQAVAWAEGHPICAGFTFNHPDREPKEETRFWFKSRMMLLDADGWWSYSMGRGD